MNIFYLHYDPELCARAHCDKHVVKMIVEYAQLLSTAHRLLDGTEIGVELAQRSHIFGQAHDVRFKRKKFWLMPDENLSIETTCTELLPTHREAYEWGFDSVETCIGYEEDEKLVSDNPLYFASHMQHPCGQWLRASSGNYKFLANLFKHLCAEYRYRYYGKMHLTDFKLGMLLQVLPKNIPKGDFCPPPLAMPTEYKVENAITAYQNLYLGEKAKFAKWTNRRPPQWFIEKTPNYDSAHFERTSSMAHIAPEGGGEVHQHLST